MKGKTEFVWAPKSSDGAIVSMVQWRDDIIIACEYGIFRMGGDPVTVQKVEFSHRLDTEGL